MTALQRKNTKWCEALIDLKDEISDAVKRAREAGMSIEQCSNTLEGFANGLRGRGRIRDPSDDELERLKNRAKELGLL